VDTCVPFSSARPSLASRRTGAKPAAPVDAVDARQVQIEDHHVGPLATLAGGDRDLFQEVEPVLQARHLQDVAQGLLAPAPLDADPPAQGGGELLGLVPGGGGGLEESAELLMADMTAGVRAAAAAVATGLPELDEEGGPGSDEV
jgi:hypothetical protein